MTKSRGLRVPKGTRTAWAEAQQGNHTCSCGCGEQVPIKPEHYPDAPQFVRGHNARLPRKERPAAVPCACGCGEFALPGKRYVYTHHLRGQKRSPETVAKIRVAKLGSLNPAYGKPARNRKPPRPLTDCACQCGRVAPRGRRYITGHNSRGVRSARYRGWIRFQGYIKIDARDHPFSDRDGYVLEHRLVAEEHLRDEDPGGPYLVRLGNKLYLRPEIVVHHIDGVKDNNDRANLMPMTRKEHTALHHAQGDILR